MPSKNLLTYLENQNIDISNLVTNSDSMENLDNELKQVEVTSNNINHNINQQNSFINTNVLNQTSSQEEISLPKIPFPNEVL